MVSIASLATITILVECCTHAQAAAGYTHLPKKCVKGHNIILLYHKTVAQCAAICDKTPKCVAFEFGVNYWVAGGYFQAGDCFPQDSTVSTGCNGEDYNLDLYVKKKAPPPTPKPLVPVTGYTQLPKACVNGHNMKFLRNKTVAQCAAICDATHKCVAFEFGVEYRAAGGAFRAAGDCTPSDSTDLTGCNGAEYNLDLYVKKMAPRPQATCSGKAAVFITSHRKQQLMDSSGKVGMSANTRGWEKWTITQAELGQVFITSHRKQQLMDNNGKVGMSRNHHDSEKWFIEQAGAGEVFILSHRFEDLMDKNGKVGMSGNSRKEKWTIIGLSGANWAHCFHPQAKPWKPPWSIEMEAGTSTGIHPESFVLASMSTTAITFAIAQYFRRKTNRCSGSETTQPLLQA